MNDKQVLDKLGEGCKHVFLAPPPGKLVHRLDIPEVGILTRVSILL